MKKMFVVEIEYDELQENIENNSPVLSEIGVEVALENMMEGYINVNSISKNYSLMVNEVNS